MWCALGLSVLPVLRRMFTASRGKEGERGYRLCVVCMLWLRKEGLA